jgi:peptide/nickel transport system substrate-binding protein
MDSNYWTRRKRFSRRSMLRGTSVAAAGLAGAVLIGCGDSGDDDDGGDDGGGGDGGDGGDGGSMDPVAGGSLTVAQAADVGSLDPALSASTTENSITMAVYNNVIRRRADGTLEGLLASSWEGNDDLSEYTLNLREGVTFRGVDQPFTSEDVKFTIERLQAEETGSAAASALAFITSVETPDDYTANLVLEGPNAFAPDTLSLYQGRILPHTVDESRLATEEFGTGPFMIESHNSQESTVFKKDPNYWGDPLPYLDEVIFQYIPEEETRTLGLTGGDIDAIWPISPTQAEQIDANSGTHTDRTPSGSYLTLAMQMDAEPFTDLRVRQAMQLATNRDLINEAAVFGLGTVADDFPIPPTDPHYTGLKAPAYDAAEAMKLLSAAGKENLEVTLHTSTVGSGMVELAQAMKESAAPAGINISLSQDPEDSYWSDVWLVEPFTTVTWNGRNPDQALSIVYLSDADWNESHIYNDELDSLIKAARGQTLEERQDTYKQVHQILLDEVPRIIPVFRPIITGLGDSVHGLVAHPSNWLILDEVWVDQM